MKSKGRLELGDVTHHNIKQMKCLNRAIFPVHYNDRFYKDVQEAGELSKLAYFNDIVVGAVCCRIDSSDDRRRLYIMTLGCLPVYRRLGLGTVMLEHVFQLCERDRSIESIYLHVQINNKTALDFYKKFGFNVVEVVQNYYKRIEPADAYVLERNVKGQQNLLKSTESNQKDHEPVKNSDEVAEDCKQAQLSSDAGTGTEEVR